MAFNFPNTPSNGDTFTYNSVSYVFNAAGNLWLSLGTSIADKRVLYSDSGAANGATDFTYEKSNGRVSIQGSLNLLD